jgi:hypothetical protein
MAMRDTCDAEHDLGNGMDSLGCDRESGHDGMHRQNDGNLWWYPGAPPLETIEVGGDDLP